MTRMNKLWSTKLSFSLYKLCRCADEQVPSRHEPSLGLVPNKDMRLRDTLCEKMRSI